MEIFNKTNEGNEITGSPELASAAVPAKPALLKVVPRVVNEDRARFDKLKEWLRLNEVRLAEATLADDDRLSHHALAVYPASKGGCLAYGAGCFAATDPDAPVYVLGDTHGDFDSFLAILFTILGMAKENGEAAPIVYLLGDIVDRNGEGCMLECALILAILQKAIPDVIDPSVDFKYGELNTIRLGIVKGDHDVGLLYAEPYAPETRFKAMVSPADYCDWLNKRLDDGGDESVTKIGRAWIRLMQECPAAVFLKATGTLLAHGGVPREDLQKRVAAGEPYLLQSAAFAQDFEWCRMVDKKKKLLNRGSKTSEIGGLEFDSFCKTVFPGRKLGDAARTKVRHFVFGHQHPLKGFEQYAEWYEGYTAICIASFRNDGFEGPKLPHFVRLEPAYDTKKEDPFGTMDGSPTRIVAHTDESVRVYSLNLAFESGKPSVEQPESEVLQ